MDNTRTLECKLVIGDTNRIYIEESDTRYATLASYLQSAFVFGGTDHRRLESRRLRISIEQIEGEI